MLSAGAGAGAVSWMCTWWRQVAGAGAGAGRRAPVPVLVLVLSAGCARGGDRLLAPVLVLGAGAGAGAVSWLCTWWRQVAAGAGAGWLGAGAVS